jgi:hypothetical protein
MQGACLEFPSWVPHAVRHSVGVLLDGEGSGWESLGWRAALANEKRALDIIELNLRMPPRDGDNASKAALFRQKQVSARYLKGLKAKVECLERLVTDQRMTEAYSLLSKEFIDEMQWKGFVAAAWAAHMEYQEFRERKKSAKEIRDRITQVALDLAGLLDKARDLGFGWPSELSNVAALLRSTDNHEMQDRNLGMWRMMRGRILGDAPPRTDGKPSEAVTPSEHGSITIDLKIVESGEGAIVDPIKQERGEIRYVWTVAPALSALLRTLASAIRDFEPRDFGVVEAATRSRQHNIKNEYIRAFGEVLNERGIPISGTVMKAIAIAANVVLNHPDIDATYDDVRKTLSL